MPASPGPWTRKGMQVVAADGKTVLTIGFTQPGTGATNWPLRDVAESNLAMAMAAPQMALALALVLEGASGANEAAEAALRAANGL